MGVSAGVVTTLSIVLLVELSLVSWAISALSLLFVLTVCVCFLLLSLDLGLFALLFILTYAPGFLYLSALLLHSGPYWATAGVARSGRDFVTQVGLVLLASLLGVVGVCGVTPPDVCFLVGDLTQDAAVGGSGLATQLHFMFYVVFCVETFGLNLLLCLGLSFCLLVATLSLAQAGVPASSPRGVSVLGADARGPRSVYQLRRTTRRTSAAYSRM